MNIDPETEILVDKLLSRDHDIFKQEYEMQLYDLLHNNRIVLNHLYSTSITNKLKASFSNDLAFMYADTLQSLVYMNREYVPYMISVTPWSPKYVIGFNDFLHAVRSIHDQIQDLLYKKKGKKARPDYVRPFLVFLPDLEGSKGGGIWLRHQLRENTNGAFRNLHMHGVLLIHKNTNLRFRSRSLPPTEFFETQITPLTELAVGLWSAYCAKAVGRGNLMNERFFTAYGFLSDQNLELTPDQITETIADWKRQHGIGAFKKAA